MPAVAASLLMTILLLCVRPSSCTGTNIEYAQSVPNTTNVYFLYERSM
jgi:hypothetical protein